MLLRLETSRVHRSGSEVLTTSWMPDIDPPLLSPGSNASPAAPSGPSDEDRSRRRARQDSDQDYGWLACGNRNGVLSITLTSMALEDYSSTYSRTNFNLCDHKNPVHIVEWNPVYRKLATCSALGAILVYEKSEDRWKVDLVNERPHQVEEFRWSRSGERVMIVYSDGLLVVGTVQGQRIWHRMMELRGTGSRRRGHGGASVDPHQGPQPPPPPPDHPPTHGHYATNQHQVGNIGGPGLAAGGIALDTDSSTAGASRASGQEDKDIGPRLPRQDEMPTLTCGTWSPGDKTIIVGTSTGYLLSFPASWESLPARRVRQVDHLLRFNDPVLQVEWSSPRFHLPAPPLPPASVPTPPPTGPAAAAAGDEVTSTPLLGGVTRPHWDADAVSYSSEEMVSDPSIINKLHPLTVPRRDCPTPSFLLASPSPSSPSPSPVSPAPDVPSTSTTPQRPSTAAPPSPTPPSTSTTIPVPSTTTNIDRDEDNLEDWDDHRLVVTFFSGHLYILSSPEDPSPVVIETNLWRLRVTWNHAGTLLAVAGFVRNANLQCECSVRLYSREGALLYSLPIDSLYKPVTSLSWAHSDRRLFVSASHYVHTLCLEEEVPRLLLLANLRLFSILKGYPDRIDKLPLPQPVKRIARSAFHHTIQSCLPDVSRLRDFVLLPRSERLYCTVIHHDRDREDVLGNHYTLYLEFMGGLIPLLRARRVGKIKPDFIIYDPHIAAFKDTRDDIFHLSSDEEVSAGESSSDEEVSQVEPGCGSPGARRKKLRHRQRYGRNEDAASKAEDIVFYDNNLPELHKLVLVQANVWGTQFSLRGHQGFLPASLGHVSYKKSLLHLLPREMTVKVAEITPETPAKLTESRQCRQLHRAWLDAPLLGGSPSCFLETECASDVDSTGGHWSSVRGVVSGLNTADMRFIDETPTEELFPDDILSGLGLGVTFDDSLVSRIEVPISRTSPVSSSGGGPTPLNHLVSRLLHSSTTAATTRSAPTTPVRNWRQIDKRPIPAPPAVLPTRSSSNASTWCQTRRHHRRTSTTKTPRCVQGSGPVIAGDLEDSQAWHGHRRNKSHSAYKKSARIGDSVNACHSPVDADLFRSFILHNKKPHWNEENQVYQLDFGGRVTQESAKNFQIDHEGKQVLQFGRLNGNTFALDFQYPFSPVQAFSVALANVTARFK